MPDSSDIFEIINSPQITYLQLNDILYIGKLYIGHLNDNLRIFIFLKDKIMCCESIQTMDGQCLISGSILLITFCFDLKFEMLYPSNNFSASNIKGIRFLKKSCNNFCLYFSENSQDKYKITKILQAQLVQRGFHQYFKPVKKLGAGSFATVFEVKRYEDNKKFAVKAFSKQQLFSSHKGKQSLINQLEILRSLDNQNVIKLEGVYQSDNSIYVSLELIHGEHFLSHLQKMQIVYFTPEQIFWFMKNLLQGLRHLHQKRIMHRDLKPQNIMLRNKKIMEPVIVDFGLGTFCDLDEYLFYRCGTPGYIAPEIINLRDNKQHVQPVCDVFSTAAIFYILITGRTLFEGNGFDEVYQKNKILQYNIDPIEIKQKTNNEYAYDLIIKMLEKNPQLRLTVDEALSHPFFTATTFEEDSKQTHGMLNF